MEQPSPGDVSVSEDVVDESDGSIPRCNLQTATSELNHVGSFYCYSTLCFQFQCFASNRPYAADGYKMRNSQQQL